MNDRPGVAPGRFERALEPLRGGHAVVVGERDHRSRRSPPSSVTQPSGGSMAGGEVEVTQDAGGGEGVCTEQVGSLGRGRVVHHHHLEALRVQRLIFERVEKPAQPQWSIVRRHHHGDLRSGSSVMAIHERGLCPGAPWVSIIAGPMGAPTPALEVSIVLPAYNEGENIVQAVAEATSTACGRSSTTQPCAWCWRSTATSVTSTGPTSRIASCLLSVSWSRPRSCRGLLARLGA